MSIVKTCRFCGKVKQACEFGFKNEAAGRRHDKCKACVAEYGREHYARNKQAYISRSAHNTRLRKRVLQERVWNYLLEHKCVDCGERDPLVLDFDHRESSNKKTEIYWLVRTTSRWTLILDEIAKCDVRCANCHRRRTSVQFGWKEPAEPARVGEYAARGHLIRLPPRQRLAPAVGDAPPNYLWCALCGQFKQADDFYATNKSNCAECFRTYRREHYQLNRQAYIQRNNRVLRERRRRWIWRVWTYLSAHPCLDCGVRDPRVLEFDHRDPRTKIDSVGVLARQGWPWSKVEAEIAKCDVRCANCHRRRTALQFDWPKARLSVQRQAD